MTATPRQIGPVSLQSVRIAGGDESLMFEAVLLCDGHTHRNRQQLRNRGLLVPPARPGRRGRRSARSSGTPPSGASDRRPRSGSSRTTRWSRPHRRLVERAGDTPVSDSAGRQSSDGISASAVASASGSARSARRFATQPATAPTASAPAATATTPIGPSPVPEASGSGLFHRMAASVCPASVPVMRRCYRPATCARVRETAGSPHHVG